MTASAKISKKIALAALLLVAPATVPASAAADWWETGGRILESLSAGKQTQEPTMGEISDAFKEALSIATNGVVAQLGRVDGFNSDAAIHIPLPRELDTAKKMLAKIGMAPLMDDLELKLNRAAEAATPKAKKFFVQAIREMSFADVKKIYDGPEDAATRYFQEKMTPELSGEMTGIVEASLSEVGAIRAYDTMLGQYKALPFVPDVKADLTGYVIAKGLDGIFHYVAREEAAIRRDPARQTTELLKRVFGTGRQ